MLISAERQIKFLLFNTVITRMIYGEFLGPPHGTTPAAVIAISIVLPELSMKKVAETAVWQIPFLSNFIPALKGTLYFLFITLRPGFCYAHSKSDSNSDHHDDIDVFAPVIGPHLSGLGF